MTDLLTVTGTALNSSTWIASPFSMHFTLSGGTAYSAGCDSWLMGAAVTGFSAEVGNNALALPSSFLANITTTPWPCGSGDVYGELVGGPLTLESQGALLTDHARLFDGNVGAWYIQTAQLTLVDPPAGVPEPGLLLLLALGCAAAWRRHD